MCGDLQISEETRFLNLTDRCEEATVNVDDLAPQIDECVLTVDGFRRDRDALEQQVGVGHEERNVLTGSRL